MGFGGWSLSLGASQGRARLGGAGVGAMGTGLGASRGALAASSDMGGGAVAGGHGTWVRAFDGIGLVHLCRDGPLPGPLPGRLARGRSFSRWVAMAACQWVELGFGAVGLGLHRAVSCTFASAGRVHRPARVCPERARLRTRHGLGVAVDGSAASPGRLKARQRPPCCQPRHEVIRVRRMGEHVVAQDQARPMPGQKSWDMAGRSGPGFTTSSTGPGLAATGRRASAARGRCPCTARSRRGTTP